MKAIELRFVKEGEFFTRKPIECPKDSQVYERGEYERSEKKYHCSKFSDISSDILLKGSTIVYVDFIF